MPTEKRTVDTPLCVSIRFRRTGVYPSVFSPNTNDVTLISVGNQEMGTGKWETETRSCAMTDCGSLQQVLLYGENVYGIPSSPSNLWKMHRRILWGTKCRNVRTSRDDRMTVGQEDSRSWGHEDKAQDVASELLRKIISTVNVDKDDNDSANFL